MSHTTIEIGSDHITTLSALTDGWDSTFCNDAIVTGTLTLATDSTALDSWDYTYQSNSDGIYRAIIPNTTTDDLEEGVVYCVRIEAKKGGSIKPFYKYCIARYPETY